MTPRVLIVEDDELLREMYAAKFELEGFQVFTAADGLAGLQAAMEYNPQLLVIDNLMPRLTGLELLERYRVAQPHSHSLVVVLSNKSSLADINRAKELGAAEYLIKSQYTPRDLVVKVRQVLNLSS